MSGKQREEFIGLKELIQIFLDLVVQLEVKSLNLEERTKEIYLPDVWTVFLYYEQEAEKMIFSEENLHAFSDISDFTLKWCDAQAQHYLELYTRVLKFAFDRLRNSGEPIWHLQLSVQQQEELFLSLSNVVFHFEDNICFLNCRNKSMRIMNLNTSNL